MNKIEAEQLATEIAEREPYIGDNWRARAECDAENSIYFYAPSHFERKPEKDLREGIAKALCRRCPVIDQCLSYSLDVAETHGIWGGLNELDRRHVLRARSRIDQVS